MNMQPVQRKRETGTAGPGIRTYTGMVSAWWFRSPWLSSDGYNAAEATYGVIRFCSIVVDKYATEAPVPEDCAAGFPDLRRCFKPTGSGGIESGKLLQCKVFLFGKEPGTPAVCQRNCTGPGFVRLARIECRLVITDTASAFRGLNGAVNKADCTAYTSGDSDDIRFAFAVFHFSECTERAWVVKQAFFNLRPLE